MLALPQTSLIWYVFKVLDNISPKFDIWSFLSVESYNLSIPDGIEGFRDMLTSTSSGDMPSFEPYKGDLALLDLYSGCGGMSTGLCLGAKLSSVNLVTVIF